MTRAQISKSASNTERALEMLRELIFSGALPAGSDHLESELALRLGMSRTPVREAALTLQSQGLIEVRARKGVRILPISIHDMEEVYDVLTALESMAAADAARRGCTDADLLPLSQSIAAMDAALDRRDREAWAAADDLFHSELVRLGGNTRSEMIVALMRDQVRRVRTVTLHLRPLPLKSNADHRGVLDAIKDQDDTRAYSIHKAHRNAAKQELLQILTQSRLQML